MDPNNTKWSKDDTRFGARIMKKAGWDDGKGIGRNEDGVATHVKTTRKDNVLGIGYEGKVQETWSTQSVGFADILKRINTQSPTPPPDDDEDGEGSREAPEEDDDEPATAAASDMTAAPSAGKHANAFNKRRNLKTEALRSADGKDEVLGTKRPRQSESAASKEGDSGSLVSPLLVRTMVHYPQHDPKPTDVEQAGIAITKPDPRPPRVTETPFAK
jgi:Pin2-interacting protein X1